MLGTRPKAETSQRWDPQEIEHVLEYDKGWTYPCRECVRDCRSKSVAVY